MNLLIKNGTIVLENEIFEGDLLIKNGLICKIDKNLEISNGDYRQINLNKDYVLPGGIDVHTHFNIDVGVRSVDDFYSGTLAAAFGGTTTIIDHMGFGPKGCNQYHQLKKYHEYAKGNSVIDYSFHGVIQHINDEILHGIKALSEEEGITSFKLYMTYDYKLSEEEILDFLKKTKDMGIIICVHAEVHEMIDKLRNDYVRQGLKSPIYHVMSRPNESESLAIKHLIKLSKEALNDNLYIVHVSAKESVNELKNSGVYAETCTQYLTLSEDEYKNNENNNALKYILSPPLRDKKSIESLWDAVNNKTIKVIATDHCSFNFYGEKQRGKDDFTKCPNGIPGVENRVPIIFSEGVMQKRIDILNFSKLISTNPAKIFGIYPKKGVIKEGADGDIVIIDPTTKWIMQNKNLHDNTDYTCYEGRKIHGKIKYTISRGEIIVENDKFLGEKGRGLFLKRKKASTYWEF